MAATYTKQTTNRGYILRRFGDEALVNSVAETAIFTSTIKGMELGGLRSLSFRVWGQLTTPALAVPSLNLKVKLGSSSLSIGGALALAISLTNAPFRLAGEIAVVGSASAQFVMLQLNQSASLPFTGIIGNNLAIADWTIDTNSDQTFQVTAQFGGLSLTTTLTTKYGYFEIG